MAVNSDALFIPGHGTLFVASKHTNPPDNPLAAFSLTGPAPAGWDNIGHTSKDNPPEFTRDGGEPNLQSSWLQDGVAAIYGPTTWKLSFKPIQLTREIFDLGFGGVINGADGSYIVPNSTTGMDRALFLLCTDGSGSLGFYMPNTSTTLEEAPKLDIEKFIEVPLTSSILAASEANIPSVNGKPGIMKIFKTGLAAPAGKPPKAAANPSP
jgi:hypothetical protein